MALLFFLFLFECGDCSSLLIITIGSERLVDVPNVLIFSGRRADDDVQQNPLAQA